MPKPLSFVSSHPFDSQTQLSDARLEMRQRAEWDRRADSKEFLRHANGLISELHPDGQKVAASAAAEPPITLQAALAECVTVAAWLITAVAVTLAMLFVVRGV